MPVVLAAEDEVTVLVLAESILSENGYKVFSAANFVEARALLEKESSIEILFTDINLGDGSGTDLAQQARELNPDIQILYTSGAAVTDGTKALFIDGGQFLQKPYRSEELVAAIANIIPGSS
jgi:DNA-binding NtrC family response regulator